ncbi:hypothetical protein GQ42DRAFT_165853 [Ramicandelaber brevisporus]|nr:hypothetical protein GQ42DRAFT_165853 [Ramicandelaber brevisporus]
MTSHHSHSSGILQNGEESNAFEDSGGERHRGTHNIAPPDAQMDIRQPGEAIQPGTYFELMLSVERDAAERACADKALLEGSLEIERNFRYSLMRLLDISENEKKSLMCERKSLESENQRLRADIERLRQELTKAHRQTALAYTRRNQRASRGLNASRSASPSPLPSNARGGNNRNINHDGLTHSIIPCRLEEMFGLKVDKNKHKSGIGHGAPGASQAGESASSDANPFWIGAVQQSGSNDKIASVGADQSVATDLSATADSGGPELDVRNSGKGARTSSKRGANASNTQQQKGSPAVKRRKTVQRQTPVTATTPATVTVRRSQRIKMKQSATTAGEEQSLD